MNRNFGRKGKDVDTAALDELTYLLESGSDRIGALEFQHSPSEYVPRAFQAATLEELLSAPEKVEKGEPLTPDLDRALLHGTSLGGARPRATIQDGDTKTIAKFPSSTDTWNVVKAEYVAMRLAATGREPGRFVSASRACRRSIEAWNDGASAPTMPARRMASSSDRGPPSRWLDADARSQRSRGNGYPPLLPLPLFTSRPAAGPMLAESDRQDRSNSAMRSRGAAADADLAAGAKHGGDAGRMAVGRVVMTFLCAALIFTAAGAAAVGAAGALKDGFAGIVGARFLDVDGNIRRLGDENGAGPAALVFVDGGCPVSARYLGEMNDFAAAAESKGIDFYAILSGPRLTWADARGLRDAYGLRMPVLFDPSGDLAARLGPVTLPEAFVVGEDDRMIYRGRIDDRFAGIGQLRRVIRGHDLLEAFAAASGPRAQPKATAPVGCIFEAWKRADGRKVTYTRDIAPVLAANCVECHQSGGVAPFALGTWEQASERSAMLEYMTAEGLMPPWRPRPRFGRFRGERYLSETQIALFAAWTENDDAEGAPADRAPAARLPDPGWRLGRPDLVLRMVEPFEVPASGDDVYRYFVIPSGLARDRTVTAIDFRPGAPSVVHHANFFADYSGKARREDAKDAEPGFSVFGTGAFMSYDNTDEASFGIGGWAPGAEPYALPEGVGLWLPKGGDIVIEIHYKLNGRTTVDRSEIGFYFADRPTPEYIDGLLIGTQDIDIPAGEASHVRHVSMDVPVGFRLVDVMPHMHYIGSKARMVVTFPDGREHSVFGIEDWDLRWQNIYALRTPLHVPAGSRIDAWFVWDNSDDNFDNPFDPPRRIRWGWKSEDEMAEVWLGVIPDDPSRRPELVEAANATWYGADSRPLP